MHYQAYKHLRKLYNQTALINWKNIPQVKEILKQIKVYEAQFGSLILIFSRPLGFCFEFENGQRLGFGEWWRYENMERHQILTRLNAD